MISRLITALIAPGSAYSVRGANRRSMLMHRVGVKLIGAGIMWLGVSAPMQVSRAESLPGKLAYWSFDQSGDEVGKESISGNLPLLAKRWQQVDGVKGKAAFFDGFTSYLSCRTKPLIEPGKGFAIEAWVAVAAYPWNLCPIVEQQDGQGGVFFGLNEQGELCFSVGRAGRWQGWTAQPAIPVRQWTHVACSFTPDGQGTLFINGQAVSCKPFDFKPTATKSQDVWIGRGPGKQGVSKSYITSHRPIHIYFDGIIDELSIMDGPANAEAMADRYQSNRPVAAAPLPPRVLKAGSEKVDGFGAHYTTVNYYPQWDDQWRVGNSQDIVVTFDGLPSRLVFWRGTGYIPAWVSENNIWVADQSLETWSRGCAEAMSDKHCRNSHVRVIESTDARAVVHWRYYLISADYSRAHIDDESDWSDCADEYFYIYPDGTAVRHQVLWSMRKKGFSDKGFWTRSHQWQETIPFTQPGQKPEDVIELEAFTVADMAGKSHTYSWANGQPKAFDELPQANIQMTNIKSKFRPFVIYPPKDCRIHPFPQTASHLSKFPWWNHWPVAQVPSDGRPSQASDRVGHFSLSFTDWAVAEETERMQSKWSLVGSTDKAAGELATLAKSWASAPAAKARSGCEVLPYSPARREYPVVAKDKGMIFTVEASEEHPIDNLCLTVRNWGHKDDAKVLVNGKAPEGLRQGTAVDSDGHDYLVVWVEMQATEPVEISISGARPADDYALPDHLAADAASAEANFTSHNGLVDPSGKSLDRFKIGFANTDFPQPFYFKGQMKNMAVYDYAMTDEMLTLVEHQ